MLALVNQLLFAILARNGLMAIARSFVFAMRDWFKKLSASLLKACLAILMVGLVRQYCKALLCVVVSLSIVMPGYATTPAGTEIRNVAIATFDIGNGVLTSGSNDVIVTTQRTPATIALFQYTPTSSTFSEEAPSSCRNGSGGIFLSSPNPSVPLARVGQVTLDPNTPIELSQSQLFHSGDPVFIRVDDADQNLDANVADSLTVSVSSTLGDQEEVQLTETEFNSGIFIGYIQSSANASAAFNCALSVSAASSITVSYTDKFDNTDVVAASTLVDPFGIVFDSANGQPVDGVTITLIDANTGLPATPGVQIFGDDGISAYPNTIVTGSSATDSNGTVIIFPAGGYRFPLLLPGQYRLRVSVSPGYGAPSLLDINVLQNLPGAPFALFDDASFGNTFTLNPGPPLHVDIPVDPVTVQLLVEKLASTSEAGIGDFVQYRVRVENVDVIAAARAVLITDVLPQGFRYRNGSARLDGATLADPVIANDGRTLVFTTRDLLPVSTLEISYVAEVTAGTPIGHAVNSARASDQLGASSNIAQALVEIRDEFMREHVTIVGRVIVGNCPIRESGNGLAGIHLRTDRQADMVNVDLNLNVNGINAFNYTVSVSIPESTSYLSGSSHLDGLPITDPEVVANQLIYRLGNKEAWPRDWQNRLQFRIQLNPNGDHAALEISAYSSMDTLFKPEQKTKIAKVVVASDSLNAKTDSGLLVEEIIGELEERGEASVGTDLKGLVGARIYMEDGTYAVTDAEGKYHFEGVRPGTHVVQVDQASVPPDMELISCEKNTRFAGKAYSKFVDVQGGTLWRTDFHVQQKPPVLSDVSLAMQSTVKGDNIELTLDMGNDVIALNNYRLTIVLSEGMSYELGSSELDGYLIADPQINSSVLIYRLNEFSQNTQKLLKLKAKLSNLVEGERSVKAYALFDTEEGKNHRTPLVENVISKKGDRFAEKLFVFQPKFGSFETKLSAEDKRELNEFIQSLDIVSIENLLVVGHTDNVPIKRSNKHIYKDNYELSEARAKVVADYIRSALNLDEASVVSEGKGSDQAIADNETAQGRAKNRRTELYINAVQLASEGKVSAVLANSGTKKVTISGRKTENKKEAAAKPEPMNRYTIQKFDEQWLETTTPAVEWLFPADGFTPKVPALNVAIKHYPGNTIEARINDEVINPLFFFGSDTNSSNTVARSYWQGIHLKDGPNEFVFIVREGSNKIIKELKRTIYYSAAPVRAELLEEFSYLVADGVTPAVIAVKFYDRWNQPVRPGVVGSFTVSEPYFSKEFIDATKANPLEALNRKNPHYEIGDHGIALIELEPTTQTGKVRLGFNFNKELPQEISAWLKPSQRDWIVVGVADATVGSHKVDDNQTAAENAGFTDGGYDDGKVAFFAKGTFGSNWLLTASVDTSKDKETMGNRLFQTINPNDHFTLYGDKAEQYYEAQSSEKVFAKIERDQFYTMFGDYATGLNESELSKYNRSVTGLKSEYNGDLLSVNVFATETSLRFVKDEIQGDGTSGLYRLSQGSNIIINSESIVIETRDRFHSQDVLQSRTMRRHFDYNIDYQSGTVFFKEPIASRDSNFNHNMIVVEYEVETNLTAGISGGGRASVDFFDDKLEIGVSLIHDEGFQVQGDLYGTDISYEINQNSKINIEFASTDVDDAGFERSGGAYLAEYKHSSGIVDGRVYLREQEAQFGLGQQAGSETGTRKYGVDGAYKLTDTLRLGAEYFHEDNLVTNGQRDVSEFDVGYADRVNTALIGVRSAVDEDPLGTTRESVLLLLGASRAFADNKWTLRLNNEISLGGEDENPAYPSRYILGVDYSVNKNIDLYAEHEITEGGLQDSTSTRAGVRASPWESAQINSAVEEQSNEFGPRVFSTLGLTQRFDLSDQWSGDVSLDRVDTIRHPGEIPFNVNVPPTSGTLNDDFSAVSVGTNYISEKSSFVNRVESRDSENEDKQGVYLGWYRDESEGIGYSLKGQWYDSEFTSGESATMIDMRFSFSYRPVNSNWIHLNRFDYVNNTRSDALGSEVRGRKFINNWKGNYLINRSNQIAFSYGLKYVLDSFDNDEYSGATQYIGTEYRHDISARWDVGLHGNVLHSKNAKNYTYSYGVDAGWSMVDNMWLSVGYNFDGFEDPDFSLAGYTAQGFFIKLRMKFDQHLFHDIKNRRNR